MHQLYVDFKKAYDSVKREKLYSTLLDFGIPKKLVIRMCLNGTKSRVRVGRQFSDTFEINTAKCCMLLASHCPEDTWRNRLPFEKSMMVVYMSLY